MIKDKLPIKLDLPDEFFAEEVRCDHTISTKIKKIWAIELDLLNEFQRVCKKHNITYFANGGTLLGAVRHKGFIPWDDDIDVMMLREDYERFCEITPDEFKHPYFLQTQETDFGFKRAFARLRNSETTGITGWEKCVKLPTNKGIFIDIFPINNLPPDEAQYKPFITKMKKLKFKGLLTFYAQFPLHKYFLLRKKSIFRMIWYKLYAWYHVTFKGCNYNTWYQQYKDYAYQYTGNGNCTKVIEEPFYSMRFAWDRKDFDATLEMPFEMLTISVPIGWENVLKTTFGDWHKFVKGSQLHSGLTFDPDKPYNKK